NGSTVTDNNSGTITAGTDSVTEQTPASYVPSSYFGQSLQVQFSSNDGGSTPNQFTVEDSSGNPIMVNGQPLTGTLTPNSSGTLTGTVSIQYPNVTPPTYWQLPISGSPAN